MPTLISHAMIGVSAGSAVADGSMSPKFWALSILCATIPDADVLGFRFGIPYSHMFGHRGFFHSICFALVLGLFVTMVFFPQESIRTRRWWILAGYFFSVAASHGILDAFTNGGLGIALLAPFDNSRYFFQHTPIQVAPISIAAFFSTWGVRVIKSEIVWIWLPALLLMLAVRLGIRPAFFPRV